jgi:hypothetical protein
MATTVYVARSLGVDPPTHMVGEIVGGDDALDTDDGDTSYVRVSWLAFAADWSEVPFRWHRLSGPVPSAPSVTTITIEGVIRKDEVTTVGSAFANLGSGGVALTSAWFTNSLTYVAQARTLSPLQVGLVTSGVAWSIQPFSPGAFDSMGMRFTYLRCVIESDGAFPHRLMQRGDGLGMGSGRILNQGTRQGSSKVFGTY